MSFEEKYGRYKKTERVAAPDGYVDDIAGKISNRISTPSHTPRYKTWSLALGSVALLAIVWLVWPVADKATDPPSVAAQKGTVTQSLAYTVNNARTASPDKESFPVPAPVIKDSGSYLAVEKKTVTVKEPDRESIVEYLLDEGYEDI